MIMSEEMKKTCSNCKYGPECTMFYFRDKWQCVNGGDEPYAYWMPKEYKTTYIKKETR